MEIECTNCGAVNRFTEEWLRTTHRFKDGELDCWNCQKQINFFRTTEEQIVEKKEKGNGD